jgi:hypothetical protein
MDWIGLIELFSCNIFQDSIKTDVCCKEKVLQEIHTLELEHQVETMRIKTSAELQLPLTRGMMNIYFSSENCYVYICTTAGAMCCASDAAQGDEHDGAGVGTAGNAERWYVQAYLLVLFQH